MSRFETIGPELDLTELAKHNRNLDRADSDLTSLQQQISAEQQARLAADSAHSASATAHPAQNITYSGAVTGATNVKQAIDAQDARINNIVAGAGSSNTEIVDARPGLDGFAHPVLKDRLDRMEQRQLSSQNQSSTINRGSNVINSDQASGATFKILGCSRCNILGRDGGCESLTPFQSFGTVELSTTQKRSGTNSIKMTGVASTSTLYKDYSYVLDATKQYLFGCWVFVESYSSGSVQVSLRDVGTNTSRHAGTVNTSLVGQWQFVPVKVPTANALVGNGFRVLMGLASTATAVVYFDEIRLYELTAAEYAAIGTTITGEAIDRRWPYADSVQHTQGLSLAVQGKNLMPPATQATSINAAWTINSPYKCTLMRTAVSQTLSFRVACRPNETYTLAYSGNTEVWRQIQSFNAAGSATTIAFIGTGQVRTVTTPADSVYMVITFLSDINGTFTLENWMLVLGDATNLPASFVPYNPQYAHVPVKLASNVDRTIADSYDSATGQVFRRYLTGVKLDGSLPWADIHATYTGFKRIGSAISPTPVPDSQIVAKYNGQLFGATAVEASSWPGPDYARITNTSGGMIYLTVSNTESGWTDGINPNANARKALLNGWKANGNNGTVYNSWVSVLTGAAPATNIEAYVAANKAPGWDAYATLDYVRATPIVETLTGDIGALVTVKGGNVVELLEGVIVREKVTPKLDSSNYYIQSAGESSFWGDSRTKLRTRQFLYVYRDEEVDNTWKPTGGSLGLATLVANYDPAADYFVDYIVLDKYLYTTNAVEATLTYQSTQGSVIAQNVQDIAAIKTHNGVQDWILAQYAARLLALEEA